MKKEKELISALMQLLIVAEKQNLIIKKIALPGWWFDGTEIAPDKLLGVEIENY